MHALADDPERIVAEFASDASLVDGSPYRNTYVALATVRDGKIQHWTEFSDPAPIERGFAALQAATPPVGGRCAPRPAARAPGEQRTRVKRARQQRLEIREERKANFST